MYINLSAIVIYLYIPDGDICYKSDENKLYRYLPGLLNIFLFLFKNIFSFTFQSDCTWFTCPQIHWQPIGSTFAVQIPGQGCATPAIWSTAGYFNGNGKVFFLLMIAFFDVRRSLNKILSLYS